MYTSKAIAFPGTPRAINTHTRINDGVKIRNCESFIVAKIESLMISNSDVAPFPAFPLLFI
jgi:hypothetical protein